MPHIPYVIGIAGGTGSGKTTLALRLQESFAKQALVLSYDSYYLPHDELPLEERRRLNYDHPDAFETDRLVRDLRQLKIWQPIECPQYSFTAHTRLRETVHMQPKPLIIVEGILLFANRELLNLLDMKVYVDADADIRLIRRLERDVKQRNRSMDSVVRQYLGTVKPMHEQFVEPSKKHADIIIPRGGQNQIALQMLVGRLQVLLRSEMREPLGAESAD